MMISPMRLSLIRRIFSIEEDSIFGSPFWLNGCLFYEHYWNIIFYGIDAVALDKIDKIHCHCGHNTHKVELDIFVFLFK